MTRGVGPSSPRPLSGRGGGFRGRKDLKLENQRNENSTGTELEFDSGARPFIKGGRSQHAALSFSGRTAVEVAGGGARHGDGQSDHLGVCSMIKGPPETNGTD